MKVKASPINVKGQPENARMRAKREVYAGDLVIEENRLHRFGRAVTTARVMSATSSIPESMIELFDVALLSVEGSKIRLRGFEEKDGVQYAQTWDVEVL